MLKQTKWLLFTLAVSIAPVMFAQLAPSGEHYAGRASDTGFGGTFANATGTFAAEVPLELPPVRGGLPIPLQIAYGARGLGAAGLGWDVPLSYIQRDRTMAHRRPASGPGILPVPRDRAYLSLFGQSMELVLNGSDWIARSGTLELIVRQSGSTWLAYDGSGRTYTFIRPANFGATGLWLLDSIRGAGGATVQLTYQINTQSANGGFGIGINLADISYNSNPAQGVTCAKNVVALSYGNQSPTPLSVSVLDEKVLVRKNLLTLVDVRSRATCLAPFQRLRRYDFQYIPDKDTRLPRLSTVRMYGRQGTPEANVALPVATYTYGGVVTQNGTIRYELTQILPLPADASTAQISGTHIDNSVNAPVAGVRYAMWQSLTDINGDGRPDLVFQKNDKLWVAYNAPGLNGQTTLRVGNQEIVQLSDATFANGAFSTQTSAQQRFQFGPGFQAGPGFQYGLDFQYGGINRNTTNVWRQAIDVNGDGRIDIIDAAEEPNHWVIYLNTPGGPTGVQWQRRSFSVATLRETLVSGGHTIEGDHVPLARRATGTDALMWQCWQWDGANWQWYPDGFHNNKCAGTENLFTLRHAEKTYIEWELEDLNGDGYPDFVFNSSPVNYQRTKPGIPGQVRNEVYPQKGSTTESSLPLPFVPGPTNQVQAMFNVRGVRFYTDDNVFSRAVNLTAPRPDQGVGVWECTGYDPRSTAPCDERSESLYAGFADVNGDGLMDRVVFNQAYLGAYTGTAVTFSPVYVALPGPLATLINTHKAECEGGNEQPGSEQTRGLRDLTGDGIPDYYDTGRVSIGTGAGFRPPIPVETSVLHFFSHETETCNGEKSNTDGGLIDIDGDGKPEIVALVGNTFWVSQLVGGRPTVCSRLAVTSPCPSFSSLPEGGRITKIDNGYGASTSIAYVSAKQFTDNPLPFPEIVISSVETTGTQSLGGTLAGSRYAYSNGEMVFDSALDRYGFSGYERVVEVNLYGPQPDVTTPGGAISVAGQATINDTWPLAPFTNALTKQERWLRMQRIGHPRDFFMLRGVVDPNPWSLLSVDVNDSRVIGVTHQDWDAKLYELPQSANQNLVDCLEMTVPLDFQLTLASSGTNSLDVCRAHGFAFAVSGNSWYGASPPPSDNNIQTKSEAITVDDFGRSIVTEYDNDVFRADDDICVANTFATPTATVPRMLSALAARRVYPCGKGDDTNITVASESWVYDGLPAGAVADGHPTSHNIDRRATGTGALLNTVHKFDAMYDATGNVVTLRTQRDGATRTVTLGYDSFGLVPTGTTISATGVPSNVYVTSYDPVSLQPLSSTDANQTKRGIDFDGFGRPVRVTVTPSGGSLGVVSVVSYLGFTSPDSNGRRITAKTFSDPVPPANVSTSVGRTGTTFLDELGRERRTEVALGSDYADDALVVGSRAYDGAGRVMFEADPYPKSQNPATAYGTSYFFKNTGDVDCIIRGTGQQLPSMVTDIASERFPTCFQRTFAGHVETRDVRDAASLQVGSPQAGVVKRVVATAIGRVIERSSWLSGARLENATFSYDRLGQQVSMTRFLDPALPANPVQWSMQLDSIGQTLQLVEPNTATHTYRYSDWGEQVETQWMDGAINRQLIAQYDAMGRLTASEERNDGTTDPETVNSYAYDVGVNVSPLVTPTFVLGQMARASSPSGSVTFSYDAFGRRNAQVFTDSQGGLYVQKSTQHVDGRLGSIEFDLPDQNYSKEVAKYDYDSAGRMSTINYAEASGSRELYRAQLTDPFGRVRAALFGGNTVFHSVYADTGRRLEKEAFIQSSLGSRRLVFGQFDALDRELSRQEIKDGAGTGQETDASYDALGRLSGAVKTDGGSAVFNWQYGYDPLGNVVTLGDTLGSAGASLSYRTDDRDKLCRIGYGPGGLGGTACNVSHDGAGNIIQQATRTGGRNLGYFDSGNVRHISQGNAQAEFRYDAFGGVQELNVTGAGVSDERHDRHYGDLIERRDQVTNGATTTFLSRNIPGPGGIVASRRGTKQDWIYQFGELRGNRFFVDGTGAFVQNVDFQPFGESSSNGVSPGSADYTSFQWNGDDALAAFGLSHLGARLYDPVIGRFLSRDPLLIPRAATASNPYAFAANDPLNAADPSGLDCVGENCQPYLPVNPVGLLFSAVGKFARVVGSVVEGLSATSPPPASDRLSQAIYNEGRYQAQQAQTCGKEPGSHFCDTRDPGGSQVLALIASPLTLPIGVPSYYIKTEVSRAGMLSAETSEYLEARDRYTAARVNLALSRVNEEAARYLGVAMMISGGLLQTGTAGIRMGPSREPPLAHVLEGWDIELEQGFSGAYDRSTGNVNIIPSTAKKKCPREWCRGPGVTQW